MPKAGPLADYVHPYADLHAYRKPLIQKRVPKTQRELAEYLRQHADEMQRRMVDVIEDRSRRGLSTDAAYKEMEREFAKIAREFFDEYLPDMRAATRYEYSVGQEGADIAMRAQGHGGVITATMDQEPGGVDISFTAPDLAAMAAIANDNFSDLAGQTQNMIDGAVAILRTEAGRIISERLAQGMNARQVARELEQELVARGFEPSAALKKFEAARAKKAHPENGARPAVQIRTPGEAARYMAENGPLKFIDRAGREWDLRRYCEMAAHTKLMIAKNEGCRNTMRAAGVNHYMFSDHASDCPLCGPLEGLVFWTGDGESLGYQEGPPIPLHPNCMHTTIPYVMEAYE